MQVEDGAGVDPSIKIRFKSAFKRLMETVDLRTGGMGRLELEDLKGMVKEVADAKSVYVRSKWPHSTEVYFSSSIGQITFPGPLTVSVSVDGYSQGYLKKLQEVSPRAHVTVESLGRKDFIGEQMDEAIKRSVLYKSTKLYLVGKTVKAPSGGYRTEKLNLGMNARSDALFFMSTLNNVDRRSGRMSVYVNNVKANTTPWEPLDADYAGLGDVGKAQLVRRALHIEIARGGMYIPGCLKIT